MQQIQANGALAMDVTSERLRQDVPKSDMFEFANPTSDSLKPLSALEAHDSIDVTKETNNNHVTIDMSNYGTDLWPTIDSSMLEEFNCWAAQEAAAAAAAATTPGAKVDNTDGAIYTLTVLNGTDHSTWFKTEDKEEKPNSSLDLDSLLNVNFTSSFPSTVKSGYNFEENNFDVKKEEQSENNSTNDILTNSSAGFNNNNEWKQENNNEVDSLLRNALQGKSISRYNGVKKEPEIKVEEEESNIMTIENPMLYETPSIIDSDNPSSAHSMDDMFLTHLVVSYPEDYEKLKRIETEVAESVEQFCLDRTFSQSSGSPHQLVNSSSPMLNPVAKPTKKYTKRSKSSTTSSASTSSGIRKERSLHYCNICSKGFKDKYSVNVHIRTHTGEKPFNCGLCGKSFRQKAHLAKHYQTHMAQAKNGLNPNSKSSKSIVSSS